MKIPLRPPGMEELLSSSTKKPGKIAEIINTASPLVDGEYAPWDKVRHLEPPNNLTAEEWWLGIQLARRQLLKPIPLSDKAGSPFLYGTPDSVFRLLHEIDQLASGRIQISEEVTNPSTRDRYVTSSLIEESITSSQLEGASTTAAVAKNMLRAGRRPTSRSEQMILNNYTAMEYIGTHFDADLTPDFILELHRIITEASLDDPTKTGHLRTDEDLILIEDEIGTILHMPPPASELPSRLRKLCDFANDRPDDSFMHPVVRAVILHFWLAYDHPFVDGNGRVARALFYWSMLSQGYWLIEYISISRMLRMAPAQYSRSFLHSEIDSNDLTYFIEYHLKVVRRAIDELHQYLDRKMKDVQTVESLLKRSAELNHRQLALLSHALRHPGARYAIRIHANSHRVVYQTARTDLLDLAQRGLLQQRKVGRTYQFSVPADLSERLETDAHP
jgi:Fic family protein